MERSTPRPGGFIPKKEPLYQLNRKLPARFGEAEYSFPLTRFEVRVAQAVV
jgi:hypothetical protein